MTRTALIVAEMFKKGLDSASDFLQLAQCKDNTQYPNYVEDLTFQIGREPGVYFLLKRLDPTLVQSVTIPAVVNKPLDYKKGYSYMLRLIRNYPSMFPCVDEVVSMILYGALYATNGLQDVTVTSVANTAEYIIENVRMQQPFIKYLELFISKDIPEAASAPGEVVEFFEDNLQDFVIIDSIFTSYTQMFDSYLRLTLSAEIAKLYDWCAKQDNGDWVFYYALRYLASLNFAPVEYFAETFDRYLPCFAFPEITEEERAKAKLVAKPYGI